MKNFTMVALTLGAMTLWAGPAAKVDPVAAAYPNWQGVTAKNHVFGRELCPSDLRHKVTIVLEIEPGEKLQSQLIEAGALLGRATFTKSEGTNWETADLPRDVIALVSNRGARNREAILAALKPPKGNEKAGQALRCFMTNTGCSVYDDVAFAGAPETAGKRPYLIVMGPTGKEPLFHGPLNAASLKSANEAVKKGKDEIAKWEKPWVPFFGTCPEPKHHPQLAKALAKGKTAKVAPLDPVAKGILKNVVSKDEEKAGEAQILFDAICQARSDTLQRIQLEAGACPHRAYYDIQQLVKYWPAEKKRVEAAVAKLKQYPEAEPLAKIFCRLMEWSRPDFKFKNASEAKKAAAELAKMKKTLEKLKESKNITVQNGALLVDLQVDNVLATVQAQLPAK